MEKSQADAVTRRQVLSSAGFAGLAASVGAVTVHADEPSRQPGDKPWRSHKTADPKEIEKQYKSGKTGAPERWSSMKLEMNVGLAPQAFGSPRPDLNGLRVKLPNAPAIYLIDQGYRRWIPDPPTYDNLFRNWDGVVVDIDIIEIPEATPLSHGASLARAAGTAPVHLVSNGQKRWVTSPAVMDKYWFAWNKVVEVPASLIDSIPSGSPIS